MKRSPVYAVVFAAVMLTCSGVLQAGTTNFAGEYSDKNFLNGQAVLQLSLEQSGNDVKIFFSAGRNDGQGPAPEIDTTGRVTAANTVAFKFEDSFKNTGTGTITRSGDDVVLSIKATRVADPQCTKFYGQSMKLKRLKK